MTTPIQITHEEDDVDDSLATVLGGNCSSCDTYTLILNMDSDVNENYGGSELCRECVNRVFDAAESHSTRQASLTKVSYWTVVKDEYVSDGAIAIIGTWKDNPARQYLVRLANIWEDTRDPTTKLTTSEMMELADIFTASAQWYISRGIHDMDGALTVQSKYLKEQVAIRTAVARVASPD